MTAKLRLELRIKNLALWRAIHCTEVNVAAFCRANGYPNRNAKVGQLLALRESPYDKATGELTPIALWLCSITGIGRDELFPPELYAKKLPKEFVAEAPAERLLALQDAKALTYTPDPDLSIDQESLKTNVYNLIQRLSKNQRSVIALRFGLSDGEPKLLSEIGKALGLSIPRIRQIEAAALRKLRHPRMSRQLKGYLSAYDERLSKQAY